MRDIFKKLMQKYEDEQKVVFDIPEGSPIEEELQYLILKQRFDNLGTFLERQKKKYEDLDIRGLHELLFFYNDLKEINFIGTDMFANALFIKNKVPFLYRSVGKDTQKGKVVGDTDFKYSNHGTEIFKKCLAQIQTGGAGELFSYTKCFGKMLYKYATLQGSNSKITFEIRSEASINAISEDGENLISIQQYMRNCIVRDGQGKLPYFAIDMSNARDNSVKCLKYWINKFLGKQQWHWHKDIVDPIGDAEVVCNFTNTLEGENIKFYNSVQRIKFNRNEICMLLYRYFKEYARKTASEEWFNGFIDSTMRTIDDLKYKHLKDIYNSIRNDDLVDLDIDKNNIDTILSMVIWENEIKYMSRRKGEIKEEKRNPAPMTVYKGDNAEVVSKVWKDILFGAIEKKYSYIDYSAQY